MMSEDWTHNILSIKQDDRSLHHLVADIQHGFRLLFMSQISIWDKSNPTFFHHQDKKKKNIIKQNKKSVFQNEKMKPTTNLDH